MGKRSGTSTVRGGGAAGTGDGVDAMKQIPMGKLPSELQGSGKGDVLRAAMDGKGAITTVNPRELKNTQPDLARVYVPSKQGVPVVARVNGKLYVVDGHHRKYRAIAENKSLKVRIIDLDK